VAVMSDGSCLWFFGVYACVYVLYGGSVIFWAWVGIF